MLKYLKEQDFDRYVGFAYELALDMTKSGYPTYADGIKTKDDFIAQARRAFSRDNEWILLFEHHGRTAGWIHYYHLPEDRYLQTCSFCIAEGMREAITEFTAFVRRRFPGSELYLGFPKENAEACAALDARGFERVEESYNDIMDFDQYILRPEDPAIVPITQDNFPLFSSLHAQHGQDMYWNSERILEAIDRWRIFVYLQKGEPIGAIYLWADAAIAEIFGVDFSNDVYDGAVYRALLTAALNNGKRSGMKHMVFFNDERSQLDALSRGFRCVGGYVCFKARL